MTNKKKLLIFSLCLTSCIALYQNSVVYNFLHGFNANAQDIQELASIKADIDAKEITEIKKNLSGITYNPNTKTLFAITNSPRYIYELNKNAKVLRTIDLQGFKDTEAITYIKKNLYAIADERKKSVYVVAIDKDTKVIERNQALYAIELKRYDVKNSGYEGLAYDTRSDSFYLANEKRPRTILKISNWTKEKSSQKVVEFKNDAVNLPAMRDFSGLHFDDKHQVLLALSDESKRLLVLNKKAQSLGILELTSGNGNLRNNIPQAEGVTTDEEHLYIVSEPNLFYRFKIQKK